MTQHFNLYISNKVGVALLHLLHYAATLTANKVHLFLYIFMLVDLLFYAHTYGCICASMYVYVYVMLLLFFELLNLLICVLFICTLTIQNTTTKYKKK